MRIEKIKKYADYMKIAIAVISLACAGTLYSCNFNGNADNKQITSLESNGENLVTEHAAVENSSITANEPTSELAKICVYVCGCVVTPGVYDLYENMRVYQAIDMAGGMTDSADYNVLNMADYLMDGQKIYVPDRNEHLSNQVSTASEYAGSTLVNINRATKEQLMTLPGIGESKAEDIIAYRTANGKFETVEDIMKISGIKEAAFAKIKDLIVVK